jgi:glycosyltransferase involved in cell wall biosynthesis
MAAYNHERFVGECVRSALDQTFQDFEFIITDDGSRDRTVDVIKQFADPRIHLDAYNTNRGACTAMIDCIGRASGEYIAVLNSDDVWLPPKLAAQVTYLDQHSEVGAVFTKASFINEAGDLLGPEKYKNYYIFDEKNRSRYAWLNRFFLRSNCLCHPSLLIRKTCYDKVGLYDERMASLPDLDMWVRLCLHYDIHILDERMVNFRIMKGEANVSGSRLPNIIRGYFEYMQILDHYLEIVDRELLLKVFPDAGNYGPVLNEYIPFFLARLALSTDLDSKQLWGLQTLYNLLSQDAVAHNIEEKYGFKYLDFHNLTAQYDVFNLSLINQIRQDSPQPDYDGEQSQLMKFAVKSHRAMVKLAAKLLR